MNDYEEVKIYLKTLDLYMQFVNLTRGQPAAEVTPLRVATPPIPVYVPAKEEKK
ncbi:MAG: hypothetical protein K940chlam2_01439 [Chlamydiae bacterium]|nr:hypothetical protein [Chlamydiota bacterium]